MYADSGAITRFLSKRRKRRNFLITTLQFFAWGFEGPMRAVHYWRLGRLVEPVVLNNVAAPVHPVIADAGRSELNVRDVMLASSVSGAPLAVVIPSAVVVRTNELHPGWMQEILEFAAQQGRPEVHDRFGTKSSDSAPMLSTPDIRTAKPASAIQYSIWLQAMLEFTSSELAASAAKERVVKNSILRVA